MWSVLSKSHISNAPVVILQEADAQLFETICDNDGNGRVELQKLKDILLQMVHAYNQDKLEAAIKKCSSHVKQVRTYEGLIPTFYHLWCISQSNINNQNT